MRVGGATSQLDRPSLTTFHSIDNIKRINAGRPFGGITFIWHKDFGCNIQVKRYQSDRILGLSVTING